MSVKTKAVKSTLWTTASTVSSAGIQLLQIMILARFLDKKDFGLMAMAGIIISVSQIFMDLGLSNAIIQKPTITKLQLSTLYWLNIFVGIALSIFIALGAQPFSEFYSEPQLISILNYVGITFFIQSFAQQYVALLQKDILFKPISLAIIISRFGAFFLSIFLAFEGYGVYSLVYSNLLSAIIHTIVVIYFGKKIFTPTLAFSWSSIKNDGFLSFGTYQILAKLIFSFTTQFDSLFIGKLISTEALGIYNIAKTLAYKPIDIIATITSKVTFPVLVKFQNNKENLKSIYLLILKLLTSINAPVCIVMVILAKPLVILCFGEQWVDAVTCMQWLCIGALISNVWNTVAILLLSIGNARLDMIANLILLLLIPVSVILGFHWGIVGVAIAMVATRFFFLVISWQIYVNKIFDNIRLSDFFNSFFKPLLVASCSGIITFVIFSFIQLDNLIAQLSVGSLIFTALYGLFIFYLDKDLILNAKSLYGNNKPAEN